MRGEEALTAEFVRDAILAALDPRMAREWRVEGRPIRARVSTIFKVADPASGRAVAVKIYRPETRPKLAEAQEKLLRRMHAAMGVDGLTVPRPLGTVPERRALLMEWIEEPQVARLLGEAGSRRQDRAALFSVAGRWLGRYHASAGTNVVQLDIEALRRQIEAMLAGVANAGRDGEFRRRHDDFLRHAPRFAALPVSHVAVHGDFNPNNLLHGPRRTVGIDLGLAPPSPVTYDIGRFLVQAETAKPFLGSRGAIGRLGSERLDLEAFLAGYGALSPALDDRQFAFLFLAEVLRRWATFLGARPSGALDLGRRVKRHRLSRMAKAASAILSG
jgi:Ser/Thr protein kinase RdoA (MazF antagonist)